MSRAHSFCPQLFIAPWIWLLGPIFMPLLSSSAGAAEPAHPSLLFSEQEIPALQEKVKQGWLQQAFAKMKSQADQFMTVATNPYPMTFDPGSATAGRALSTRLATLGLTGIITGDQRYLDHATSMVMSAIQQSTSADFKAWNDHLAVGDAAQAYAIAYDWLYTTMTPEQRQLLRNELIEFGQWLYTDSTRSGSYYGNYSPTPLSCNHNSVMHGGMGLCALALGDRPLWVDRASKYIGGYYQYSLDTTGYSYEGMGYFGYGYWGGVPYSVALKRSGGPDLILAQAKNRLIPPHTVFQMAPWGKEVVAMNDSNARIDNSAGLMHLISVYQDRVGLWAWLKMFGEESDKTYGADPGSYLGTGASLPYVIIFADASLQPQSPEEANFPISKVYSSGRGSYRTGWGPLDALATFTCGFDQHRGHNHKDENSFTFFARGEKFIIDPGYQPWETRSHNTILVNGFGQWRNATEYDVVGKTLSTKSFGANAWSTTGEAKDAFHANVAMSKAVRHFLFVKAEVPYIVIADDYVTTSGAEADYTWLLHTDKSNTITVDPVAKSAIIIGSKRNALCKVQLLFPQDSLTLEQTNLTGQTFVARDVTYSYDRYFKELRASVRATNPRFVAVLMVADNLDQLPLLRWEGTPDNMTIRVGSDAEIPGNITDTIRLTTTGFDFSRQVYSSALTWPETGSIRFE